MGKVNLAKFFAKKGMQRLKQGKSIIGNIDSISLFPFAKSHRLNDSMGRLSEGGMVLTHLTDFLPKKGVIDTARSAIGASRDSVHFAVNHAVTSHAYGNWEHKPIAIMMPMLETRKMKGNRFFGGIAADFYSRGPVRIPKGSIIVRQNSKIPAGKYKLQDATKFKELKDMRGCYVVEVSEGTNTKNIVDKLIRKMGFKLKNTENPFYWGDKCDNRAFEEFKRFNTFLKEHGMQPAMHTYTPNGKLDLLIMNLQFLCQYDKKWLIKYGDDVIFNYKKEYLKVINDIEKLSRKTGYGCDLDLEHLKKIIKKAKTPTEAQELLKKEMGISGSFLNTNSIDDYISDNPINQDIAVLANFNSTFGGKPINTTKYLNIPNQDDYYKIEEMAFENQTSFEEIGEKFEKYMPSFEIDLQI